MFVSIVYTELVFKYLCKITLLFVQGLLLAILQCIVAPISLPISMTTTTTHKIFINITIMLSQSA